MFATSGKHTVIIVKYNVSILFYNRVYLSQYFGSTFVNNSKEEFSVGRCVIPCAFFGKSVKHTFSCRKMYPV